MLTSASISPTNINAGGSYTITVDATDDISGVSTVWYSLKPAGNGGLQFGYLSLKSGSIYEKTVTLDQYAAAGSWIVDQIVIKDIAGNQKTYLSGIDFNVLFIVGGTMVSDITPPALNLVTVFPTTAKPGDTITVTMDATDNLSGLTFPRYVSLLKPDKTEYGTSSLIHTSGTTYQATIVLDPYAVSGSYSIGVIYLVDQSNNSKVYRNGIDFNVPTIKVSNLMVDTDADGMPDLWEQQYGLNPLDVTDAALDLDGDGVSNLAEFLAGTDPSVSNVTAAVTVPILAMSAGSSVPIPVSITPGIGVYMTAFNIGLSYDNVSLLTVSDATYASLPAGWTVTTQRSPTSPNGTAQINLIGSANGAAAIGADTSLYLPLRIAANAALGQVINLTLDGASTAKDHRQKIALKLTSGVLTVGHKATANYTLNPGWNLISFPMYMGQTGMRDFLTKVPETLSIWTFRSGQWKSYFTAIDPALNSLQILQAGEGYWIKMPRGASKLLTMTGPPPVRSLQIKPGSGWNLIGVTAAVSDVGIFMRNHSAASVWSFQEGGWRSFISGSPAFLNSLQSMQPGEGYYVWLP